MEAERRGEKSPIFLLFALLPSHPLMHLFIKRKDSPMPYTPIIHHISREQAEQAEGIVVVIDVIRAFTVAAYAFAGGAQRLWLVRTVEEALALREREPGALLAGEIGGRITTQ
jgi:hypothetical protein